MQRLHSVQNGVPPLVYVYMYVLLQKVVNPHCGKCRKRANKLQNPHVCAAASIALSQMPPISGDRVAHVLELQEVMEMSRITNPLIIFDLCIIHHSMKDPKPCSVGLDPCTTSCQYNWKFKASG